MNTRTFVIGDIHGDIAALDTLLGRLPALGASDTLVFLGDYLDRGPCSREVIDRVRELPSRTRAKVIALRGNHEDAWLRVVDKGWPEFILPRGNGCLSTMRSFQGRPPPADDEGMGTEELVAMLRGTFFPPDVVAWMRELPYFHEDEHAIYVHAGLPQVDGVFLHPDQVKTKAAMLWCRDEKFFRNYAGKLVVFGHTKTELLPPELSSHTPEDPSDMWAGPCTIGLDTGCGKEGGFLTALELPAKRVYESR